MAIAIETQSNLSVVPGWAVAHLGKPVCLMVEHDFYGNGLVMYRAGGVGMLDAIQYAGDRGNVALVEFVDDEGCLVDIPFSKLEPVSDLAFSPDLHERIE